VILIGLLALYVWHKRDIIAQWRQA